MASSSLSTTISLRAFTPRATSPQPSLFSPKHIQFPIRTPKLTQRATSVTPRAAVAEETVTKLGDTISNLTLSEAQQLVEYLQEKLGVTAASFAPAAVVAAPGGGAADAPAVV
ncbi:50S ribosomal protein L12, chloroplastic-like protein, partial [Tanacetum coccineum]